MSTRLDEINRCEDNIQRLSTDVDMLKLLKGNPNTAFKVTRNVGASLGVIGTAATILADKSVTEVAALVVLSSAATVCSMYAVKKGVIAHNKSIDYKIEDKNRHIEFFNDKKYMIEEGLRYDDVLVLLNKGISKKRTV